MYPERCFGAVESIDAKGIAKVRWVEDSSVDTCKLRDLTVEKRKFNVDEIVMMLVEGNKLTFVPKHDGQKISSRSWYDQTGGNGSKQSKQKFMDGMTMTQ